MISNVSRIFKNFASSGQVAGLLLLVCTVTSLLIANGANGEAYLQFFKQYIPVDILGVSLNLSLEHWINDGLMTVFFLMVGLEVKRELLAGELSAARKAILPVAAAVGGMVVPALIHLSLNFNTDTQAGFAIPMATDIAFALGILALAGKRVPLSVKIFLTALAIIDDLGAILVIALFYTQTIYFGYLLAGMLIWSALMVMNRSGIRLMWLYLIPGVAMWYCFLHSGVHATLSGVLLAFVIPFRQDENDSMSHRLLHYLHRPVAFLIVPVFALANTAILLPDSAGESLLEPNSLGIIFGLTIGKLIGIFSLPLLLVRSGLAQFQEGITLRNLFGIGLLGGIGFTMSVFITNLAFNEPELIISSKISILVASSIAAIAGLTLFLTGKK